MARIRKTTRKRQTASREETSTSVSRHERIALLAYRYWEQRGCPVGTPDEDWFRAERDVDISGEIDR